MRYLKTFEALVDSYVSEESYYFYVTKDEKYALLNRYFLISTSLNIHDDDNYMNMGFLLPLDGNDKIIFEKGLEHFIFDSEMKYRSYWMDHDSADFKFFELKMDRDDLNVLDNAYVMRADVEEEGVDLPTLDYKKEDFKRVEYQKGFMLNQDLGL